MEPSIIASTPDDFGTPQARWDRQKFDDFITDKGQEVYIDRAVKCPCRTEGSGAPKSDCRNCGGCGWFFIDRTETKVASVSLSSLNKYQIWTENNMGTVSVSVRPEDKMGYMDRITFINYESWYSEVLYPKLRIEDGVVFSFMINTPINVFDVYRFIDGPSKLKPLIKDTDYSIQGNKIVMIGSVPDSEKIQPISVRYTYNPTFNIIDVTREAIRQKDGVAFDATQVNQPLHFIARRTHFLQIFEKYNGDWMFDNTNYDRPPLNYDQI